MSQRPLLYHAPLNHGLDTLSCSDTEQVAPPSRPLRRRHSITMPGSLYPRPPSTEPESASEYQDEPHEHRVRFAPGTSSPLPKGDLMRNSDQNSSSSSSSSWRSHPASTPSVRSTLSKFDHDADPSILLPRTKVSPGRSSKGKERDDHYFSSSFDAACPFSDRSGSMSVSPKGKERAYDLSWDDSRASTSGALRVMNKEKELKAARETKMRRELDGDDEGARKETMQDKIKIKMLEQEIERLKEEVLQIYFSC